MRGYSYVSLWEETFPSRHDVWGANLFWFCEMFFECFLTMMSKCGSVMISVPSKPLALIVRSGRKMKVFFISKLTESSSSLSSRSYFSFHSLEFHTRMCVKVNRIEKNQLSLCLPHVRVLMKKIWFILLEYVWTNLLNVRLWKWIGNTQNYFFRTFIAKLQIALLLTLPPFTICSGFVILNT